MDVFLTDAGRAFADEVSARTADALASLTGEPAPLARRRLQALLERVLARPTAPTSVSPTQAQRHRWVFNGLKYWHELGDASQCTPRDTRSTASPSTGPSGPRAAR